MKECIAIIVILSIVWGGVMFLADDIGEENQEQYNALIENKMISEDVPFEIWVKMSGEEKAAVLIVK